MPRPRPPPRRTRAPGRGADATTSALLKRLPDLALALRHDPAVDVEELLADGPPATEVRDREELRRRRIVELRQHVLEDRPVARLPEDALRLSRPGEVDERLRLLRLAP